MCSDNNQVFTDNDSKNISVICCPFSYLIIVCIGLLIRQRLRILIAFNHTSPQIDFNTSMELLHSLLRSRRPLLTGMAAFGLVALLTQLLAYQQYQIKLENEHKAIVHELNSVSDRLKSSLSQSLSATKTLAFVVEKYGVPSDFNTIAKDIVESNKYIDALELTHGGVITHVYPLEGNESVIGYDVLSDTLSSREANQAIERRELFFAGPLTLKQGGIAVIGRLPIFKDSIFQGFSVVLIKLSTLLNAAGVDTVTNNHFYYQLSKINPNTKIEEFFLPQTVQVHKEQSLSIEVPYATWKLYVSSNDHTAIASDSITLSVLGFILAIISGLFIRYWMKQPEKEVLKVYKAIDTSLSRISDSIVSLDKHWRYTFLNDAALATHPSGRKETLGKRIWDVHTELKGTPIWDKFHEAMETGKAVEVENYYPLYSSWFQVKVYPSSDGLTLFYRNITEQKEAETRIGEEKNLSNAIVNSLPGVFYLYDRQGKFLRWNKNFETISGYTTEEVATMHPLDFFDSTEQKLLEERISKVFSQGSADVKAQFVTKDGKKIPYYFNGHKVKFNNEDYLIGMGIDMSYMDDAAENLRVSESRYQALIQQATDAIFISNENRRYIDVNTSACKLLGYSKEELLTMSINDVVYSDENAEGIPYRFQLLKEGKTLRTENKLKRKDGSIVEVEINAKMMEDGRFVGMVRDITERKRAERILAESENRLRTILQTEPECIKLLNVMGEVEEMNPAGLAMIEAETLDVIRGRSVLKIIDKAYRESFTQLIRKVFQGGSGMLEFKITGLKGTSRWLETHAVPLRDADGKTMSLLGVTRDITERRKAQDKLRDERTLLRTLIDNLPDYIYVKDVTSRYLINNSANVKILGRSTEEETLGKSAIDFFGEESGQMFHIDDQFIFNTGQSIVDRDEIFTNYEGELQYLLTTKIPLKDSQRNIIGLVGISRNITKQKQIELDLLNTNYFLRLAQNVGKIGHWILEVGNPNKLTWSDETCRIFGITQDEFDGKPETYSSFVYSEDVNLVNSAIDALTNEYQSIDHRIILRDGTLKWIHVHGKTTRDDKDQITGYTGIIQDITHRKKIESDMRNLNTELEERVKLRTEQLHTANKEMEAFTYSVSHDLRSPLRIIDGYSQILIEDYDSKLDEPGQKILGIIKSSAKKMGQLIDDLLNFSRIGRVELRKVHVNMEYIVDEVIAELKFSGEAVPENVRILNLKPALCDASLVKLVWMNLLSNAFKYSSHVANPTIEVGMIEENGKVIYYVKDNGAGFDMHYYHKLFGVFQRLHSHSEFSGTGVGLAIVQRIIIRHGGYVRAESKLNEGATFLFNLG